MDTDTPNRLHLELPSLLEKLIEESKSNITYTPEELRLALRGVVLLIEHVPVHENHYLISLLIRRVAESVGMQKDECIITAIASLEEARRMAIHTGAAATTTRH